MTEERKVVKRYPAPTQDGVRYIYLLDCGHTTVRAEQEREAKASLPCSVCARLPVKRLRARGLDK